MIADKGFLHTFGVRALVVAHKKKRSRCTETERTDPHVVFPLCTFGCDYLYEQCHVTVCDGAVVAGNPAAGSTEAGVVAALVGRVVDPRWTGAPAAYFDNVNLGGRGRVPDKEAVTTE